MNYIKNITALLLALAMGFSLAACAGDRKETGESSISAAEETAFSEETEPVSSAAEEPETSAGAEKSEAASSRTEPETEPHAPDEEDRALEGLWHGELDAGKIMEETLSLSGLDAAMLPGLEKLSLPLCIDLEFRDGAYCLSLDEEAAQKALDQYLESLKGIFTEFLYTAGELENRTREETDAEMKDSYGMGVEEFADSLFRRNSDFMELDAVKDLRGSYMTENGRIYFGSDRTELLDRKISVDYRLDGEELTIRNPRGNALELDCFDEPGAGFSLVFHR